MARKYINIIISVIIIVTICIVTYSITYAWFSVTKQTSDIESNTSGKLDVVYEKGQDIGGTLKPSKTNANALTTTATISKTTTSVDGNATIYLHVNEISDEFKNTTALKWEVYQNGILAAIKSGNFSGVSAGSDVKLVENYRITSEETTFTVKLWLNGDEIDGDVNNKTISGYIDASAVSVPANLD